MCVYVCTCVCSCIFGLNTLNMQVLKSTQAAVHTTYCVHVCLNMRLQKATGTQTACMQTLLISQAGVHPFDGVLQTVVKPVWNIPVGGTAYWQVSLRGCNADQYDIGR